MRQFINCPFYFSNMTDYLKRTFKRENSQVFRKKFVQLEKILYTLIFFFNYIILYYFAILILLTLHHPTTVRHCCARQNNGENFLFLKDQEKYAVRRNGQARNRAQVTPLSRQGEKILPVRKRKTNSSGHSEAANVVRILPHHVGERSK